MRVRALADALCEGVCAHLTLMSRTGAWPVYSEYILYETVLRVARTLAWDVECEYELPKSTAGQGDHPRIDFVFSDLGRGLVVPLELKWVRNPTKPIRIAEDLSKLRRMRARRGLSVAARWLAVAGRHEMGDRDATLRSTIDVSRFTLVSAAALGRGKSARGMSIFAV